MSVAEHVDEHEVLTVRIEDNRLDSLAIRNSWRSHYTDAHGLSIALSELIRQALPPAHEAPGEAAAAIPTLTGPMPDAQWNGFWNEFNLWRRKSRQLRERIAAGEVTPWEPVPDAVDSRERVAVDYQQGRFENLALRPDWVEQATIQELNDVINEFATTVDLIQKPPQDSALAEIHAHRHNALRYLR